MARDGMSETTRTLILGVLLLALVIWLFGGSTWEELGSKAARHGVVSANPA